MQQKILKLVATLSIMLSVSFASFAPQLQFAQASSIAELVSNTVTTAFSSSPYRFKVWNDLLFMNATNPAHGTEIWVTDGTSDGTTLFKDFIEGTSGYGASLLGTIGPKGIFDVYSHPTYDTELWVSDGTTEGTTLLKDIQSGSGGGTRATSGCVPCMYAFTDTHMFFLGNSTGNTEDSNLWKTDGTTEGTIRVKINSPQPILTGNGAGVVMNGTVYFSAAISTRRAPDLLWKSDGTDAGTVQVHPTVILTGVGGGAFENQIQTAPVVLGSEIYFFGRVDATGYEFWKSDGTEAGTVLVKDITAGAGNTLFTQGSLTVSNGVIYFVANDGVNGTELWRSDGTEVGTFMVKDINPGMGSASPANLTTLGSELFFTATDGTNGTELWKTDGTELGTVMVKDINPGASSASPSSLAVLGSALYFQANDGVNGAELWKTDGTEEGTVMFKDINPGANGGSPNSMTVFNGELYFQAGDAVNGTELWKSDGTTEGTILVKDISNGDEGHTAGLRSYVSGGKAFVDTTGGSSLGGREPWTTDGAAGNFEVIKDIRVGASQSLTINDTIASKDDIFYFWANDGINGSELWSSDTTADGTYMVKDIVVGATGGKPFWYPSAASLTFVGDTLFFAADDGVNGIELWKSDGTEAGTVMVKNIRTTSSSSEPKFFQAVGNTLYFAANDGTNGIELWKSDGTDAGTVMVRNMTSGSGSSFSSSQSSSNSLITTPSATLNNRYYAYAGYSGDTDLIRSDGTSGGTINLNVNTTGSANITNMATLGNSIIFTAQTTANSSQRSLMKLNIDENVETILELTTSGATPQSFTVASGTIFFVLANDTTYGTELWVTDGTTEGTHIVKDINPGTANSSPTQLYAVGDTVYFSATNGTDGLQLWKSDGTEDGTYAIQTLANPEAPFRAYDHLYFFGNDGVIGLEPYRFAITDTPTFSTVSVSSITKETAELSVNVSNVGSSRLTERGFAYGIDSFDTELMTSGDFTIGTYTESLTGLTCGTSYTVKAQGTNASGESESATASFTTSACASAEAPRGGGGGGGSGYVPPAVVSALLPTITTPVVPQPITLPTPTPVATIFTRNLTVGSQGTDVTTLQTLLIQKGYLAQGYATGYFGTLTQSALSRYQAANNITPAVGFFGPLTRSSLGGQSSLTIPTTPVAPTTPPSTTFTRNLTVGSRGTDVTALQNTLIQRGYLEAGNNTGYFGTLTQGALIKLQQAENITPASGFFGPITRERVGR